MCKIGSQLFPIWGINTAVLLSNHYAGHAFNDKDVTHLFTYLTHSLSIYDAPGTVLSLGDTEVTKSPHRVWIPRERNRA